MLYYCAVGDDHDYIYLNPSGAHIVLEVEDEVLNVVKNLLMNKRGRSDVGLILLTFEATKIKPTLAPCPNLAPVPRSDEDEMR